MLFSGLCMAVETDASSAGKDLDHSPGRENAGGIL